MHPQGGTSNEQTISPPFLDVSGLPLNTIEEGPGVGSHELKPDEIASGLRHGVQEFDLIILCGLLFACAPALAFGVCTRGC